MNETGKTMRVTEKHIVDEVEITLRKTAGNEKCKCKITANNAASAINGICIIVQEYEDRIFRRLGPERLRIRQVSGSDPYVP